MTSRLDIQIVFALAEIRMSRMVFDWWIAPPQEQRNDVMSS